MSDLISREGLLKQIEIDSNGEPGCYGDTWKFIDTIKNMPSAQPKHDISKANFLCPICGAEMEVEVSEWEGE